LVIVVGGAHAVLPWSMLFLVKHVIALRLVGVERGDLTPKDASYLGTTQPGQLRDRAMRLSLGPEDQLDLRWVNLGRSTQRRAGGP